MDVLEKLGNAGVIPVVVLDRAEDAVPTANALLAGGVDVMEITFRTAAAQEAIRAVARECPQMTVGAGTVVTLEQCKQAVACGARFIVSPGYSDEVVRYCVEEGVTVTPGCVTPTEIMMAMSRGLRVVKFFPANIYGGLQALKALSGPFPAMKFIPTGGVNETNLAEFAAAPYVHAVGGSWLCGKADIAAGQFDRITELCKAARSTLLGYEMVHLGINASDERSSEAICDTLRKMFDFPTKYGNSSNFAGNSIEVMKSPYLGLKGHIAIRTNSISRAVAELEARGFRIQMDTAKYKNGRMQAVYLDGKYGGFAIHLVQK